MLIFHLKLWDRSARCSSLQSFGHISNELNFSVRYGFWISESIYSFLPGLFNVFSSFFSVCVCVRVLFPSFICSSCLKWKFSQTKTVGLCKNMQIHICRFSFRFGVFFFFLALEKKSDKQREIQKRNGMERKSQVILPRKWQCRNKEKRKRSGASKNHREEK